MRTVRCAFSLIIAAMLMLPALVLSPLGGGAAAAVRAQDTTPPSLVSISFSPATVTVSGLNTVPVTIRVRLTDDTGVVETKDEAGAVEDAPRIDVQGIEVEYWAPNALEPIYRVPPLKLTSGTAKDGIWSTVVNIPSTYNGVHHATAVEAQDAAGNRLAVDPRTKGIDPTLTVFGHNRPRFSVGFSPDPVRGYGPARIAIKGRATYSGTGLPITHLQLILDCGWGALVRTDSRGYYSITDTYYPGGATYALSLQIGETRAICRVTNGPRIQFVVSAAAARNPIRLGQSVEIKGNVVPPAGGQVHLQRLVSKKWRTVNHATVRSSGRYVLIAEPPTIGNHRYRVYKPGSVNGHYVANVSRTLLVRMHS